MKMQSDQIWMKIIVNCYSYQTFYLLLCKLEKNLSPTLVDFKSFSTTNTTGNENNSEHRKNLLQL